MNWIVVIWILAGLVGLTVQTMLYRRFVLDERYVKLLSGPNEYVRLYAIKRRQERARTYIALHFSVVAIGFGAFFWPNETLSHVVTTIALLAIPYVLALDGWRELGFQNRMVKLAGEE